MENPVLLTWLNDFIFCPASIYYHMLDEDTEKLTYQCSDQLEGTAAHEKSDTGAYSTKKSMLQGISVYSEKYNLMGKIDTFDAEKGILTERKKKIKTIYDGYVFQLYGQYFALTEMGYTVNQIRLYSIDDNKTYPVALPQDDKAMCDKFEKLIDKIGEFELDTFEQDNSSKCERCIYEPLCSFSVKKG